MRVLPGDSIKGDHVSVLALQSSTRSWLNYAMRLSVKIIHLKVKQIELLQKDSLASFFGRFYEVSHK